VKFEQKIALRNAKLVEICPPDAASVPPLCGINSRHGNLSIHIFATAADFIHSESKASLSASIAFIYVFGAVFSFAYNSMQPIVS
jgi:hypothetical protein